MLEGLDCDKARLLFFPNLPRGGAGHSARMLGILFVNIINTRHFSDFTGFATRTRVLTLFSF